MRYLNHEDIMKSITYNDVINAVEEALLLYKNNEYDMPERFHYAHKDDTLLYMPCFSNNILGTKILTVFPGNKEKNHPVIDGIMLLNDYDTGEAKAMLDGKILTALRTGAVGSMGIKYISDRGAKTLGLIGAGAQGIYQIIYACQLREIKDVYIYSKSLKKLQSYVENLRDLLPGVSFHPMESAGEVLEKSEIIITATSSYLPVLPEDKSLYKSKTFIAIGSYKPDMRELPSSLIEAADEIYVDTYYATEESGDLNIPLQEKLIDAVKVKSIASLVSEGKILDNKDKTIIYKSVGMALFDIIVAQKILTCSESKGIGQIIKV